MVIGPGPTIQAWISDLGLIGPWGRELNSEAGSVLSIRAWVTPCYAHGPDTVDPYVMVNVINSLSD